MQKSSSQPLLVNERTYEALGDMRMDKIKTVHIQEFINSLTKPGVNKVNPEKGLSYKTIKHYCSFISEIFDYALRIEMLTKNPCTNVKLPPEMHSEKKIYTPAQAEKFVDLLYSEAPLKHQLFATIATLNVYVHAFNAAKAKATDEIAEMLHLDEKYSSQTAVQQ